MAVGILVPLVMRGLGGLLLCSALVGLGHIFFHVSTHNLVGAYGGGESRARNFATLSLGASIAAFIGPSLAGISIDGAGFRATHLVMAAIATAPAIIKLPEVQERLKGGGVDPQAMSTEQLTALFKAESAKWAKVIADAKIQPE